MCLVIRFQLLFGNVRACTLGAYFCAMIAVGECPWLLPWFHQFWWNGGLVLRPGRGMKPPNMTRGFWSFSAVLIGGFQPPNETAVHTWHYLSLGLKRRFDRRFRNHRIKPPNMSCSCQVYSAVVIGGQWPPNRNADVPLPFSGLIRRSHSAARPPNETADRHVSRAMWSFHVASCWPL